jgi:hypothetical protein
MCIASSHPLTHRVANKNEKPDHMYHSWNNTFAFSLSRTCCSYEDPADPKVDGILRMVDQLKAQLGSNIDSIAVNVGEAEKNAESAGEFSLVPFVLSFVRLFLRLFLPLFLRSFAQVCVLCNFSIQSLVPRLAFCLQGCFDMQGSRDCCCRHWYSCLRSFLTSHVSRHIYHATHMNACIRSYMNEYSAALRAKAEEFKQQAIKLKKSERWKNIKVCHCLVGLSLPSIQTNIHT